MTHRRLSISLSVCITLCLSHSLPLFLSVCLTRSPVQTVSLSVCLSASCHVANSVSLSLHQRSCITLSFCFPLPLCLSVCFPLALCLPLRSTAFEAAAAREQRAAYGRRQARASVSLPLQSKNHLSPPHFLPRAF